MPKLAAAIITGTMARPSSPSVRFTALPAPTMMNMAKTTKNQPRLITSSLKNGNTSDVAKVGMAGTCASLTRMTQATPAMTASTSSRARPEKPLCACLVTFR